MTPSSLTRSATRRNVVGRIAAVSVPAGGSISASKITTVAATTLVMRVPRGMRAVAIPLDRVKGVGNLIQPGDHVDVIAVTPPRANTLPKAATILRDVAVLAMGTALETPQGATPAPESGFQTASLAVTPDQAKLLTLVDLNATLRLALRAPSDGSRRPTIGEKLDLTQPVSQAPRVAQAAAPAAPQPPARAGRRAGAGRARCAALYRPADHPRRQGHPMKANVAIVVGSKGGAGATSLCVEAVTSLGKRIDVAIVDGDLVGRRATAVLLDKVRALDAARTTPNMAFLDEGRTTIVEITATLHGGFTIKPADVQAVADDLVTRKSIIIVDAPQPFAAAVRPFVMQGGRFIMIVEPSILGITSARVTQLEFQRFGIPPDRLDIVCVTRDPRNALPRSRVESALGRRVVRRDSAAGRQEARARHRVVHRAGRDAARARRYAHAFRIVASARRRPPSGTAPPAGSQSRADQLGVVRDVRRAAVHAAAGGRRRPTTRRYDTLKSEIHDELMRRIDPSKMSRATDELAKIQELRAHVDSVVGELLLGRDDAGSAEECARLKLEIVDEAVGLGPLEDLLRLPDVSEIMVNGPNKIYIERNGRIEATAKRFSNEKHLRATIERIIAPLGRRVDEAAPMVDARLADGSRVNAIVEPLALNGAVLTIRRFGTQPHHGARTS